MTSGLIDRRGNLLCTSPIERHVFENQRENDFLCRMCQRPRALHEQDGFRPGNPPHSVSMDPAARYRGYEKPPVIL